mmetsp:Transcript_14643/g.25762  ORF Transcript_14643/g.25762 Transcript_14643/m.25762 type:complete len:211 (+) Transcript_14643:133-765(+)
MVVITMTALPPPLPPPPPRHPKSGSNCPASEPRAHPRVMHRKGSPGAMRRVNFSARPPSASGWRHAWSIVDLFLCLLRTHLRRDNSSLRMWKSSHPRSKSRSMSPVNGLQVPLPLPPPSPPTAFTSPSSCSKRGSPKPYDTVPMRSAVRCTIISKRSKKWRAHPALASVPSKPLLPPASTTSLKPAPPRPSCTSLFCRDPGVSWAWSISC